MCVVCIPCMCLFCFFLFFFVILFYVGTHSARGYSSGDPRSHHNTHIQLGTTQSQSIKSYTRTLCGQWQHFFQVVQGCRAGFEPRISHSSCSTSSLTATESLLHPSHPTPCALCVLSLCLHFQINPYVRLSVPVLLHNLHMYIH